jgi:hypothetical protein
MKKSILLILLLAALLSGCDSLMPPNTPSPEPIAPAENSPEPGEDLASTEDPEEAPMDTEQPGEPTPVIPATTSAVCVPPSDHPDLAFSDYESFPQVILDYLNAGASSEELAVTLIINGWGPEEQPVWAEDLNGDGVREMVATVYNPQLPPEGAMLILNCVDGQYVLAHVVVSETGSHAPRLLHIQDINADRLREVVYSSTTCGAHTCFQGVQILQWDGEEYQPRLEGSTLDYPYPEVKMTDFNHDGIYSLEVTGTAIASVGAGPQRDTINIWEFDTADGIWKLTSQTLAASPFRIHALHDAEAAIDRGEYEIARLLFQDVIESESLLEWAHPEDEYNTLAAYAYYKQVVAYLFLGDRPAAMAVFDELKEQYSSSAQAGYVQMAEAFLTDSEELGLEGGCTSAREYASSNEALVLTPLGSAAFGYANPEFEPADVCP